MSDYLNIRIVIVPKDLEGDMDIVRRTIRVKFDKIAEEVIEFVEKVRGVKLKKEWLN